MAINPIFSSAMLGVETHKGKPKKAKERRAALKNKAPFELLADETELASLNEVEQSKAVRQVKSNESEDARDDHEEHGYYTPMGRVLEQGKGEHKPSVDLEG